MATFIVSMKVKQMEYITPGSIREKCADCGAEVSIAPSSQRFIEEDSEVQILCVTCAFNRAEATDEKIEVIPINSRQEKELRDHFNRN